MTNKNETLAQPSLLDGYSTDNIDKYLTKALITDKQQKQLIKRLYQDREEIVSNCAPELALQAVITESFISTTEGKKLAGHFLVDAFGCRIFWDTIRKQIISASPKRTICQCWGEVILYAWKYAGANPLDDDAVSKKDVEANIIQELFFMIIRTNRKYSRMYLWILDGLVSEEEPGKKFTAMVFRCLLPNLWRHLDVPNEDVRITASNLLLRFYPLRSDDDFLDADYLQKQHEAMERMLMDVCLPIRVEAVKKVLYHLGQHWKNFPTYMIKDFLDKIVDELSFDSAVDVRAAVYEGMIGLLHCVPALNATQHALGLLGNRGINDKTEKVRLAAFKLLNKLKGHRFIKYFDIVEMDDLLRRLDFEHSGAVQSQIVILVYKSFSPKLIEGIDYIERFKRIRYMNKVSRTASLNFHRLIHPLKLATMDQAVRHIRSLLIGVKAMLKQRISRDENKSNEENDDLVLDMTGATVLFNEMADDAKENTKITENIEKLSLAKNILDSAIVLWTSIRFDLYSKFSKENVEVIKIMANILNTLDPYSNTVLMDSALVIASNLPKDKVGRLFTKVLNMIQKGQINENYFGHYVDALASWDLDKLIEMIVKGLEKLRSFAAREVLCASECTRDSPPVKRAKALGPEVTDQLKRPLDFIRLLLASPNTSENLKAHFGIHLNSFCENLLSIRNSFAQSLKTEQWKNVDLQLMISAYECLTLLSLITTDSEVDKIDIESDDEDKDQFEYFSHKDFMLLKEIKWLEGILAVKFPPNQVIQMFLRCANLHLDCGKINITVLSRMARLLDRLKERMQRNCGLDTLKDHIKKSLLHLLKALEYNEDQVSAQQVSEIMVQPMLEFFRTNENNDVHDDIDSL